MASFQVTLSLLETPAAITWTFRRGNYHLPPPPIMKLTRSRLQSSGGIRKLDVPVG